MSLRVCADSGCVYHGCDQNGHAVCPAMLEHYNRVIAAAWNLLEAIDNGLERGNANIQLRDALNENEPPRAAGG